MKTALTSFLCVILLTISCADNSIERKAKNAMDNLLKELAKDPSSVKLSNEEVLFSNDSLCIIHVDFTGKNSFDKEVTDRMEYIYLISNDTAYETVHEIDGNGLYLTEEDYDKTKINKIYQKLDYPQGLYYLSSREINSAGNTVGVKSSNKKVHIPSLTGTGDWELGEFKDEFGDGVGENYIMLFGWGEFTNSATTNSKLMASLQIYDEYFCFHLYEYGDIVVKGEDACTFKIKDSKGNVHDLFMLVGDRGLIMGFPLDKYNEEMKNILAEGGEIAIATQIGKYSQSTYRFKMDVSGYDEAVKFLK